MQTNLERDILPMRRVDGLDDGHGVLELAAPAEELAVQGDVFGEFCAGAGLARFDEVSVRK